VSDGQDTCQDCEDQGPEFDRAIAAVDYAGPWPGLISRLKFQHHTGLAQSLGSLMARAIRPRVANVDLIVPLPLSRQRQVERGFNQAWLLTQGLSSALRIPASDQLLTRHKHTSRLMGLNAQAREQEIRQAFSVTTQARMLIGRHVAVVDDVMTTGATLNAAAAALLDAGAASVSAWVLARTPAPSHASPTRHATVSARDRATPVRAPR
jgi:ComF family protein